MYSTSIVVDVVVICVTLSPILIWLGICMWLMKIYCGAHDAEGDHNGIAINVLREPGSIGTDMSTIGQQLNNVTQV